MSSDSFALHLVVDACGVRHGSAAVVIANLIRGWQRAAPGDRITVLTDLPDQFPVPAGVVVRTVTGIGPRPLAGLWARSVGVRRACRQLQADALLSAVTASAFLGAGCRTATIVHDMRHEVRPEQFTRARRIARRLSYGWTFRRTRTLLCNSERTRGDVIARRPRLVGKAFTVHLGADHAAGWQPPEVRPIRPYVLAFGHFANKNAGAVLEAWRLYSDAHPDVDLHVCGLDAAGRADAESRVAGLGIADRVRLLLWLSDAEFESEFAGASVVLFPSDFEGFGLPAVEAMVLGLPLVVSRDPALVEVTGGQAVVADDLSPQGLAAAIDAASHRTDEQRSAAARHAAAYTWARTAARCREILLRAD